MEASSMQNLPDIPQISERAKQRIENALDPAYFKRTMREFHEKTDHLSPQTRAQKEAELWDRLENYVKGQKKETKKQAREEQMKAAEDHAAHNLKERERGERLERYREGGGAQLEEDLVARTRGGALTPDAEARRADMLQAIEDSPRRIEPTPRKSVLQKIQDAFKKKKKT